MHGAAQPRVRRGQDARRLRAAPVRSWQAGVRRRHRPARSDPHATIAPSRPIGSTTTDTPTTAATCRSTSEAGDRFMRLIGVDEAYLTSGRSLLHRREPPQLHRPEPRRRPPLRHRAADVARREALAHLHGRSSRRRRLGCSGTAEHMMLHVDAVATRRRPPPAVARPLAAVARPTPHRRPSRPVATIGHPPDRPGASAARRRSRVTPRGAGPSTIPRRRGDASLTEDGLLDLLGRRPRQLARRGRRSAAPCGVPMRAAQNVISSAGARTWPGRTTTATITSSSVSSLGTPYAAASSTLGCSLTTSSTSNAEMFSPRRRMLSVRRPTK